MADAARAIICSNGSGALSLVAGQLQQSGYEVVLISSRAAVAIPPVPVVELFLGWHRPESTGVIRRVAQSGGLLIDGWGLDPDLETSGHRLNIDYLDAASGDRQVEAASIMFAIAGRSDLASVSAPDAVNAPPVRSDASVLTFRNLELLGFQSSQIAALAAEAVI